MKNVTRTGSVITLVLSLLLMIAVPFRVSAYEIPSDWDGDVNLDGDVTVEDVSVLINGLILHEFTPSMDVDADSLINIHDLTALITILLNMPPTIEPMTVNGVGFRMIYVRGGTFTMGATSEQSGSATSHERPPHQVSLAPFYIGETEVTQALWRAVMGDSPGQFKGLNRPVENVTWNECQEFVDRLSDLTGRNFRLLSEAEWEFAARGGRKSKGYVYAGSDFLSSVGWYSLNSNGYTHTVLGKSANELGLYDMSGNVWEWVQDYWSDSYSSEAQINPVGPVMGNAHVVRGGGWDDAEAACRVSNRDSLIAVQSNGNIGLRIAMEVDDNHLTLSRRVISLEVGEQRTVNILNGSGNYTIYNNGTEYASCNVSGDKLVLTGLKEGTANIVVKDNATQAQTTLTVIVYEPVVITPYIINGVEFKMVYVKGGTYTAGATKEQGTDYVSNERPTHAVTLSSFCIGQTEVTQELWRAVMGDNPSQFTSDLKCPVEKVSWEDCQLFIARLNELTGLTFRLPTEAEWEYAARGGRRSHGYKYAGSNTASQVAWYSVNSSSSTHPVAQKLPNELSLYDMSGNVSEWCYDWYGTYSNQALVNPVGPYSGSYRVSRGGNWSQGETYCRVSRREIRTPSSTVNLLGMRLAMDAPESRRFALSHTVVCLEVGQQRNVNIINGSGDYSVYNSKTDIVGCQLSGETLTLTGLAVGMSSVIVVDNATGAMAHITVIVTKSYEYHTKTYYIHGVPFNMVYVPQGVFSMGATDGSTDEKPVHRVALSDYYIGETEVTQALWHAVMDYGPEVFSDEMKRPMADVSWEDCQVFVARLSEITGLPFRLPTEAEWEYAARGGRKSQGYKYAGSNTLSTVGWYSSNSSSTTHQVAGKKANELGIYDMSGNVSEWCLDWYDAYSDELQFDPIGPDEGAKRVVRGGAYNSTATNCRVSKRASSTPTTASGSIGLRLALDFDNSYRLYLSQSVIYMEVDEFKRVRILNGSGDYSVYSNNNGVVDYQMNGSAMEFTGLKAGRAYFVVRDNVTHARRLITVIVNNPSTPAPEPKEFKYKTISWWMMYVRDGAFDMGATSEQGSVAQDDERPVHRVALNDYYIGQTEVTQELWQAVMNNFWDDLGADAKRPVESIDWEDCLIFVDRLNEIFADYDLHFRLPTEAEWEFAARGGNRGRGYKYAGSNTIGNVAWYQGNSQTPNDPYHEYGCRQVKTKTPNELGLYDMSGNVAEWCSDYYGSYTEGGQFNPFGPPTGDYRVVRGGSYYDAASKCRVSARDTMVTGVYWTVLNGIGMRLAMDASNTHRFYLSRSVVRINVGEQANVNILHGTGQYSVAATQSGIVSHAVNGDQLSITGLKKGYTTLIVTDVISGERTTVTVIVSEPYIPDTEVFTVNGVSFKMITVNGGTFTMGDNSIEESSPAHQVTLSSYKIGQTEVTVALWEAVMQGYLDEEASALNYPVLYASWYGCQEFLLKLNQLTGKKFRLLTEAEWEFAARGGNRSHGYTYSGSNTIGNVAWYIGNSDAFDPVWSGTLIDVATKAPNELGIYDMSGGVWEMCQDYYDEYTAEPQTNPTGPTHSDLGFHVVRGGCYNEEAERCRVAARGTDPIVFTYGYGLRLALDVDDSPKFGLSETVVTVEVGESKTVNILNGGGSYSVAGSTDYFTRSISGNKLTVTGKAVGTSTVHVTDNATGATAVLAVIVTYPTTPVEHEYVDLGLPSGTLWATCNVGASSPEEYGDYFAWGETEPKEVYDWSTYKWCNGTMTTLTKYCTKSSNGTVDNKTELEPEDDAAYVNWGKEWRMPTYDQYKELHDNCTAVWTTMNGVNGRLLTGPNGNTLFLPAASYIGNGPIYDTGSHGLYWSRTLYSYNPENSYYLYFYSGYWTSGYCMFRDYGLTVRPVRDSEPAPEEEEFTVNGVSFKMVTVDGGTFMMGAADDDTESQSNEKPAHQVTLSTYKIGQTEVTQELWQAVMGSNPSDMTGNLQRPVECVNWNDCQEFIMKLNQMTSQKFRMPTEAEWEFAARGGNQSNGYLYAGSNTIDDVAWYRPNESTYGNGTRAVANKAPNELGLYDMTGNVTEWCQDLYGNYTSSAQTNPTGSLSGSSGRVYRGGSWSSLSNRCRVTNRNSSSPMYSYNTMGLRLALDENNSSKFRLSETVVSVDVGESKSVNIFNGNGNYSVFISSTKATATVTGNMLTVTGKAVGTATVHVTNTTNDAIAVLTVIVTEPVSTDGQIYDDVNGFRIVNRWIQDRAHTPDVWTNKPYCNTSARTAVISDGYIYIARSNYITIYQGNDTLVQSVIFKLDANNGKMVKELPLTLNGTVYGGTVLSCNNVGVDDFGHLYMSPFSNNLSSSHPIYLVDKESGALTLIAELNKGNALNRIDYIDVIGDVTRNQAECTIMMAGASSNYVYQWHANQGGSFTGGFNGSPSLAVNMFYPESVTQWGYAPFTKILYGNTSEMRYRGERYYVDGFTAAPLLYNLNGGLLDSFKDAPSECQPLDNGVNGVCQFELGGRRFLAYAAAGYTGIDESTGKNKACQVYICEIGNDDHPLSNMQFYWMVPNELGTISDGGTRIQSINVEYGTDSEGNDKVTLFIFKCYNGMAVYDITYDGTTPITPLSLSESQLNMVVGMSKSVDIFNGSGSYSVTGGSGIVTTSVSGNQLTVTGVNAGTATLTVKDNASGATAVLTVIVTEAQSDEHEYVDLGLPSGTLWATCNVGASSPEEYGDYFAWGETEPKSNYSWATYNWCNGSAKTLTKYCDNSNYGAVDNIMELAPEDDAATANWGEQWRTPSKEQVQELIDNCSSQWTTRNGVYGRLITGSNGASLFMPAAGFRSNTSLTRAGTYGYYWSRTLHSNYPSYADYLGFYSSSWGCWYGNYRYDGHTIRPVRIAPPPVLEEEEYTVNGVSFKMVTVDGGTFMMGGDYGNGRPSHQVTLSDYKIGQTEVTQALWQAVMGSNPSEFTGNVQRPVDGVTWLDCQTFILKLNQLTGKQFRLPTEAEWEFAARGGKRSLGYIYSGGNVLDDVAWYWNNSNTTQVVGTKKSNELGLYDMTGNVNEWCQDWYVDYTSTALTNPVGPATGIYRIFRGSGIFGEKYEYDQDGISYVVDDYRVVERLWTKPNENYLQNGLRLALDVDNSPKFGLSETVVTVKVGESKTVSILNGGGSYTWAGGTANFTSSVSGNRLTVRGTAVGTNTVTVTNNTDGAQTVLTVIVTEAAVEEHEYVDLGLPSGTLWATCNVGASIPEEYGDYFAWGETEPKETYAWSNYRWCNGTETSLTKYCNNGSYGTLDNKTELEPEDDAAYVNWGSLWRMPTNQQQKELSENCTWTWTTRNGVNGRLVTGPNGNSIFLPAAGFRSNSYGTNVGSGGSYWSRSLGSKPYNGRVQFFISSVAGWNYIEERSCGLTVRPVRASQN